MKKGNTEQPQEAQLALVTDKQAEEGIQVKVTQNDLIDMLVDEQLETIAARKAELNARYRELDRKNDVELDEFCKKALAEELAADYRDPIVYRGSKNMYYGDDKSTIDLLKISNRVEDVSADHNSQYISVKGFGIEFNLISKSKKYKITSDYTTSKTFKTSKKLVKEMKEHNQLVIEFIKEYEGISLNRNKLVRQIKNKFTKDFVKKCPATFKKALSTRFAVGIDLQ